MSGPGPGFKIAGEELGCLFGNKYDFTDELKLPMTPGATLHLDNLRGDVKVSSAPANELILSSTKTVCANSEPEARKLADSFKLSTETTADGLRFAGARRATCPASSLAMWKPRCRGASICRWTRGEEMLTSRASKATSP
jgi:hypothetical protein